MIGTVGVERGVGRTARGGFLVALGLGSAGCHELFHELTSILGLFAFLFFAALSAICGVIGIAGLASVGMSKTAPTWPHLIVSALLGLLVGFVALIVIFSLEVVDSDTAFGGSVCMTLATPMLVWPGWAMARKIGSKLTGGFEAIPYAAAGGATVFWLAILATWAYSGGVFGDAHHAPRAPASTPSLPVAEKSTAASPASAPSMPTPPVSLTPTAPARPASPSKGPARPPIPKPASR